MVAEKAIQTFMNVKTTVIVATEKKDNLDTRIALMVNSTEPDFLFRRKFFLYENFDDNVLDVSRILKKADKIVYDCKSTYDLLKKYYMNIQRLCYLLKMKNMFTFIHSQNQLSQKLKSAQLVIVQVFLIYIHCCLMNRKPIVMIPQCLRCVTAADKQSTACYFMAISGIITKSEMSATMHISVI